MLAARLPAQVACRAIAAPACCGHERARQRMPLEVLATPSRSAHATRSADHIGSVGARYATCRLRQVGGRSRRSLAGLHLMQAAKGSRRPRHRAPSAATLTICLHTQRSRTAGSCSSVSVDPGPGSLDFSRTQEHAVGAGRSDPRCHRRQLLRSPSGTSRGRCGLARWRGSTWSGEAAADRIRWGCRSGLARYRHRGSALSGVFDQCSFHTSQVGSLSARGGRTRAPSKGSHGCLRRCVEQARQGVRERDLRRGMPADDGVRPEQQRTV